MAVVLEVPGFNLAARQRESAGANSWTARIIFVQRSIRHSLRNVDALVMAIALPVMLMLLFTYVFGGAISSGGNYVNYVIPGIILLCAGYGASSTAVDVANDMTTGVIDRFRAMPIRSFTVLTGHVVASLARNLLATSVVLIVGVALGFRPTATAWGWLAGIALITLFIVALTWLFTAIGLGARSVEAASGYGFAILFLPYLSSAFVPTETMPSWLQWVADNQPFTPVIETLRALLTGGDFGASPWFALGWCTIILIGSWSWAKVIFRRKTR